jgi:hypothetical protein
MFVLNVPILVAGHYVEEFYIWNDFAYEIIMKKQKVL